ncbi:NACHT, LRR and PYD domains-containing protein 12-like isoform X3 [Onychostoma macrolepis]|uniref:NACHT, LRR and PYD domains-containing protein 12-like isoform X3 n=1 Tax=Onychostoma macrolepis TaxID=369639 RepID=UPI002729CC34|nr:NACHT, LRR and PYD domains-containing protein 12-like isoform X3 [Onychostoma macrolepis]
MFEKILQKENTQNFVKDFNENRCRIKEAALDLTLFFLREMKQDEAADTLEDELIFIHQLKCSLKKKYQCVFEGIAKQGDSTLLKNIYTDLYITQGCSEQVNTEHEVRQIEVASRRHESQEIQVECKNLFEAPEQDKQIRTVLTKGVAGIGKSVSVQKFVLDWAEGKENQDISFIFPLPFREMNVKEKEKLSLMDLITQFFPETKGLKLTRRNQFKVLFILDGLDECRLPVNFEDNETWSDISSPASLDFLLTNLIKGNLLPSALIWITTRPAAASKIPPDCIDRLTEIRGFNDAQKEEYFRKRLMDENQAKEIIDHVKQSKSLFIMCHIPVFCWISATVLQNILEEKRNNVMKNNQADDASRTLQKSNTEDTPKTLTQMYTHFLRFQIQQSRRKYDGEYTPDVSWDKDAIFSLGKLAFHQLERNNVIFYDTDLEACGIDVYKASVYSGMCTQIFKEETGIILGTMYCFVHLSIQEFIAALYAHLFLDINKKYVFDQDSTEQENKSETMIDLLKTAVDKALESNNGHLDLFLRFLLGLSLQSNQRLLQGLLTQQNGNDQSNKEIVQYIKQKFEANLSPERSINLFYCLNELNDQTLVKEIQTHLSKGSLSSADLSPAQWSALAFVLLTSEEELEEFELQKFKKSDECLIRLSAVIKTSKRALLNDCGLTDKSCSALATVLGSDTSLKELNMNNNNLQDSGVKLLCTGLENMKCHLEILRLNDCGLTDKSCSALAKVIGSDTSLKVLNMSNNNLHDSGVKLLCTGLNNINCKLEIMRLSDCSITEEGYKALASALRSNPSHLIELDLTGNDPGQSGVKQLSDLLQDPDCQLKTLRFLGPAADEACQYVTGIVGKNPLLLRELNLSEHELGDTRVNQIAALLQDKHCQLNTLILNNCCITEGGCHVLAAALNSNPSNLTELDLSENKLGNPGMKIILTLFENVQCRLEKLNITDEGCAALASAFNSNLRELDLSRNQIRDSGVTEISSLLRNSQTLQILRLSDCSITEEGYKALSSALRSNPSHLIELDLTGNDPGQSGVKQLSDLLQDPNCQLKTLRFLGPAADEACQYVTGIVGKNPLLLRELNLSEHELGDTRVNQIAALLQDKHCQLHTLLLSDCSITEEGYKALSSALRSNPSHLIELDLTGNDPGQSGVKQLSDLLQDPNCQLKTLRFLGPAADEACQYVTGIVGKNPLLLRELNLSGHELGDTRVNQIAALLQDKHCQLNTLILNNSCITEGGCRVLAAALNSNPSNLTELDLSENKLGNPGMKIILTLFENVQCRLEKLKLNCISITDEGCAALASAFNSNLRELDLSRNQIRDSGVTEISSLLRNSQTLQILRLSDCSITEEGYKALSSALRSNPSHLIELDLTGNDPGQSGVKQLSDLLQDPNFQLKTLRFLGPAADEACQYVTGIVGKNPLLLRELNLSGCKLGDTRVNQIAALLQDKHCQLNTLMLNCISITEEGCAALASTFNSNLRELDLSRNQIGDSGVTEISSLLRNSQTLQILRLSDCSITEEGYKALSSALRSNPSHLIELDLTGNDPGQSGVKQLSDLLQDPNCQLKTLRFVGPAADEACQYVTGIVGKNPLFLRELNLSEHELGDTRVNQIAALLQDKHCQLNTLILNNCCITEGGCHVLAAALNSNPSNLTELDLSENKLGNPGMKIILTLFENVQCRLEKLK